MKYGLRNDLQTRLLLVHGAYSGVVLLIFLFWHTSIGPLCAYYLKSELTRVPLFDFDYTWFA